MKTNKEGRELIQSFESFLDRAYLCPGDRWTIGWGFTDGVKKGDTMTREEADKRFEEELAQFEAEVLSVLKVPLNENQFSALVSLNYNIGKELFSTSTLLRLVNIGQFDAAAKQFERWVWATTRGGKKIFPGLIRRREAERALFTKPVSS